MDKAKAGAIGPYDPTAPTTIFTIMED